MAQPKASARAERWLARAASAGLTERAAAILQDLVEEHEAVQASGVAGRKARSPRSAKTKGRRAVVEVRDLLLATYPVLEPDDILIQTTSVGGQDLHLSPRAGRMFPYAIEVKNVESLNLWKTIEQAKRNAGKKGRDPIIFARRNTTPLHVVIDAVAFVQIVRELMHYRTIHPREDVHHGGA